MVLSDRLGAVDDLRSAPWCHRLTGSLINQVCLRIISPALRCVCPSRSSARRKRRRLFLHRREISAPARLRGKDAQNFILFRSYSYDFAHRPWLALFPHDRDDLLRGGTCAITDLSVNRTACRRRTRRLELADVLSSDILGVDEAEYAPTQFDVFSRSAFQVSAQLLKPLRRPQKNLTSLPGSSAPARARARLTSQLKCAAAALAVQTSNICPGSLPVPAQQRRWPGEPARPSRFKSPRPIFSA